MKRKHTKISHGLMCGILLAGLFPYSTVALAQDATNVSEAGATETTSGEISKEVKEVPLDTNTSAIENPVGVTTETLEEAAVAINNESLYFALTATNGTVSAGDNATFQLRLRNALTDETGILKNTTLKITLIGVPNTVKEKLDLTKFTLLGVTPTLEKDTLVYSLNELKNGLDINVSLEIPTENGVTPSGTTYSVSAELTSDSLKQPIISQTESVAVASQSVFSVTNSFVNVLDSDVKVTSPRVGDETIWQSNVGLTKLKTGSKFLKEGSQVIISYQITGDAIYSGVTENTPQPTTVSDDKKTITWIFEAPTLAEQSTAPTNLFEQNLMIQIKVNDDAKPFSSISTETTVNGAFIDGETQSKGHGAKVMLTQTETTEPPFLDKGTVWGAYFYGPSNGKGYVSNSLADLNPTVYPDALLGWKIMNGVGHALNHWETNHPTFMEISYTLDGHQDLAKFYSYAALYRPSTEAGTTLTRQPEFDFIVEYEDGEKETIIPNVQPDTMYSFEDGSHVIKKTVKRVILQYNYVPSANFNPGIYLYTKPKPDYTGEVTLKPSFRIAGNGNSLGLGQVDRTYDENGIYDNLTNQYFEQRDSWKSIMGKRSANVIRYHEDEKRVYSQNIMINTDNKLRLGDNNLTLTLMNLPESQAAIEGTIESYVVLPVGVRYLGTEDSNNLVTIVTDDYNQTKQTLLKVEHPKQVMASGQKLVSTLAVTVDSTVLTTGSFQLLTNIKTDSPILLPDSQENPFDLMPTLEVDSNDLNHNNDLTEAFFVSTRTVDYVENHGLSINESSGFVGANQQGFLKAYEGDSVAYQFTLGASTDETLENVQIMGVLPDESDYGLVTLVNRDSQFGLTLAEPIQIEEYRDAFNIYYSTEKYVQVAGDLDQHTRYPQNISVLQNHQQATSAQWLEAGQVKDWSKIKSFKIVEKSGTTISSQKLNVTIPLRIPEKMNTALISATKKVSERSAYLNVAFSANNYLPIENLKSGVFVNRKVSKKIDYVDEKGNQIHPSTNVSGDVGEAYEINLKDFQQTIKGYTFKTVTGSTKGVFSDSEETITYVYTKNTGKNNQQILLEKEADDGPIKPSQDSSSSNQLRNPSISVTEESVKSDKLSTKKGQKLAKQLPKTGEIENSGLLIVGLGLTVISYLFYRQRKFKE